MEWKAVAVDPVTNEEILVLEMHCPPDDTPQEFYDRINEIYSDCERHWGHKQVLLVRRKKWDPDKVKTKKGRLR